MDGTSLLIGLGNPGIKYALTRHNAGALLAERLSEKSIGTAKRVWSRERKFFSEMAEVRVRRVERVGCDRVARITRRSGCPEREAARRPS